MYQVYEYRSTGPKFLGKTMSHQINPLAWTQLKLRYATLSELNKTASKMLISWPIFKIQSCTWSWERDRTESALIFYSSKTSIRVPLFILFENRHVWNSLLELSLQSWYELIQICFAPNLPELLYLYKLQHKIHKSFCQIAGEMNDSYYGSKRNSNIS
jgi:hypothetical protein